MAALQACEAEDPAQAVIEALMLDRDAATTRTGDALIESLIAGLPRGLSTRLSIASRAKAVGLSPSRLQHRFRAHTGMALRPYLRWRRLLTGLSAVREGSSLTDAALTAGFADAAHFSRTLRRHFGVTPRVLLGLR